MSSKSLSSIAYAKNVSTEKNVLKKIKLYFLWTLQQIFIKNFKTLKIEKSKIFANVYFIRHPLPLAIATSE